MQTQTAIRLAHDDHGSGEPAAVLIPGWCGDRTVFDDLVSGLSRHRRAVAVDLREHGESDGTGGDFTTSTVVDDLVETMRALGLDRVVPVALSHAGWAAIELRRRLGPDRVPGIVLLDWMVLGTPPGFADALAGLQEDHAWQQVRAALFGMWTEGVESDRVHRYVASMGEYGFDHWRRAGREIAGTFAAEGSPLEALARLEIPCPTLHLYAQPHDDAVLSAQQAYAAASPWFQVQRLDAHSHFPMLEIPQQMVDAVEAFTVGLPAGRAG
jgi:pimeloyl-ACP methyl ester carboxylesterase